MSLLIQALFVSLFVLSCGLSYFSFKNKSYVSFVFCTSLSLKIILFYILDSGLKYSFVLDSLKYELDAWNIMKAEVSNTPYILEAFQSSEYLNPFTRIMVKIFALFGKFPELVSLLNIFVSLILYYFCVKIFLLLSDPKVALEKNTNALALCALLAAYPSLNIWSVTNTKDPWTLMFSFAGIYVLFNLIKKWNFYSKAEVIIHTLFFSGLIFMSQLFRPYVFSIFWAAFFLGALVTFLAKKISYKTIIISAVAFVAGFLVIFELVDSAAFTKMGQDIFYIRKGFLNEDWVDDYAKSAFLVNFTFKHAIDYFIFLPQAITYYFFGPFIWDIHSFIESLGLIEVSMIVFLIKSFFRGLRLISKTYPLQLNILMSLFVAFSLSQCLFVSNLGTIFRHRSITILIYFIISAMGLSFAKKEIKNT